MLKQNKEFKTVRKHCLLRYYENSVKEYQVMILTNTEENIP